MNSNVGTIDRVVRIALAALLFSLFFVFEGNLRFVALLGLVPLLTGAVSFCPLYRIFGMSTCPTKTT